MLKKCILKSVYILFTLPVLLLSLLCLTSRKFRFDLGLVRARLCQTPAGDFQRIMLMLVAVEDRRFLFHFGVDFFAILRATYKTFFCSKLEGASTIEQQFVRTCTGRYEVTGMRKVREILISVLVSFTVSKIIIAHSYYKCAYYGFSIVGPQQAGKKLQLKIPNHKFDIDAAVIALVRFPMPDAINDRWLKRHATRTSFIQRVSRNRSESDATERGNER